MILASASPRRRELIAGCGIDARILPADIDKARLPEESPTELVRRLAREKAHAVSVALTSPLEEPLLAADTIVWDDSGDVLGKPEDEEDACCMLRALSGRTHYVSTGVCLLVPRDGTVLEHSFVETTEVTFWDLSEEEIARYAATGEPLDKAGAYGIQGLGHMFVKSINGNYDNVVGLPVGRVMRVLGGRDEEL